MAACARCGGRTRWWRSWCRTCSLEFTQARAEVTCRAAALASGTTAPAEWQKFLDWAESLRFPEDALLRDSRRHMFAWLTRYVDRAIANDDLDEETLAEFDAVAGQLPVGEPVVRRARDRLQRARSFWLLRTTRRPPSLRSSLYLEPDEICHFEERARRIRQLASGPRTDFGTLTVTDRRILFVPQNAMGSAAQRPLTAIARVCRQGAAVWFETNRGRFEGHFYVNDPEWLAAVVDVAVQAVHRPWSDDRTPRAPSPELRRQVWVRDGGKCRHCGSTDDLEFDHIIPYSKGGATTLDNLQLLCLPCNRRKGARI